MKSYYLVFCINGDNEREKKEYFDKDYQQVLAAIIEDTSILDVVSLEKIY